jgi:3-oxoacyl-[acyl-carrier protein] reductase
MKIDLKGKTALVTGASRGIGKVVTKYLLDAGAIVIGTAQNQSRLDALTKAFECYKDQFSVISADLTREEDVQFLCKSVLNHVENIDIIINNAGVLYFEYLAESSDEMLMNSFAVNVFAPFKICRYFVPQMIQRQWGRIINVCSSSAYFGGGTPKHCTYSATKHALLGFSRALDDELREHNIRIGTVSPAGVATDMVADREDLDSTTFMSPEDVAEAVMYLVTSDGPGIVYEIRMWRMHR